MLTFLRKIRKSLIKTGAARKYLVYAIGEILLVMIGILLALQVNNWNEWKKDRIKEKEILGEIVVEIQSNVQILEGNLASQDSWSKSYEIMINVIREKPVWNDSLKIHVCTPLLATVPTISFSAYESLRDKGADIILNKSLQKDIIALYEKNYGAMVTIMERILVENIKPLVPPFVTKRFVRSIEHQSWGSYFPNDYEKLINDQEYVNLLTYVQGYRIGSFNQFITNSLAESHRVVKLVAEELDAGVIQK